MCSGIAMIGRIVIVLLSLVFGIAGLAILIAGALVKANSPVINGFLDLALAAIKAQSKNLSGTEVNTDKFDINELVGSLAIIFIIVGAVFLFMGILGIAGACCTVRILLKLYMLIVVIILAAQIVFVVVLAGDRKIVTDPPRSILQDAFHENYAGLQGADTISLLWNVIMSELQCCGIESVSDIKNAPKWQGSQEGSYVGPAACCKKDEFSGNSSPCVTAPDDTNSNTNTPCYEEVIQVAFQGIWFIIGALASIGFHALLAFFAYAILSETSNKNKVGAA